MSLCKAEEWGVTVATAIDGAMCQWHMFSTDRNEVQTNVADGKIGGTIDMEVSLSIH